MQFPHVGPSVRSPSQPLVGSPSQSACEALHVAIAQAPATHFVDAAHAMLHGAQLVGEHPKSGSSMETHTPSQVFCVESHGDTVFVFTDVDAGFAAASAATRSLSAPMICAHAAGISVTAAASATRTIAVRFPRVTKVPT